LLQYIFQSARALCLGRVILVSQYTIPLLCPRPHRMASMEATHSAEVKAIQQRTEAAESSLTLKESELNRAKEKVLSSYEVLCHLLVL